MLVWEEAHLQGKTSYHRQIQEADHNVHHHILWVFCCSECLELRESVNEHPDLRGVIFHLCLSYFTYSCISQNIKLFVCEVVVAQQVSWSNLVVQAGDSYPTSLTVRSASAVHISLLTSHLPSAGFLIRHMQESVSVEQGDEDGADIGKVGNGVSIEQLTQNEALSKLELCCAWNGWQRMIYGHSRKQGSHSAMNSSESESESCLLPSTFS